MYIYGQAYHLMLKTAVVFLKSSGEDWQLAAIPKNPDLYYSNGPNFAGTKTILFANITPVGVSLQ